MPLTLFFCFFFLLDRNIRAQALKTMLCVWGQWEDDLRLGGCSRLGQMVSSHLISRPLCTDVAGDKMVSQLGLGGGGGGRGGVTLASRDRRGCRGCAGLTLSERVEDSPPLLPCLGAEACSLALRLPANP